MPIISKEGKPNFWIAYYSWANTGKIFDIFFSAFGISGILGGLWQVIDLQTAFILVVTPFGCILLSAAYYRRSVFGNQVWIESWHTLFRKKDLNKNILLSKSETTHLVINVILGESISSWSFRLHWESECIVRNSHYRPDWKRIAGRRDRVICIWADAMNRCFPLKFDLSISSRERYVPEVFIKLEYSTNEDISKVIPSVKRCIDTKFKQLHDFICVVVPTKPRPVPAVEEIL